MLAKVRSGSVVALHAHPLLHDMTSAHDGDASRDRERLHRRRQCQLQLEGEAELAGGRGTLSAENQRLRSQVDEQEARIARLEQRPIVSSMFSGGINATVAIGVIAAGLVNIFLRRRRERRDSKALSA